MIKHVGDLDQILMDVSLGPSNFAGWEVSFQRRMVSEAEGDRKGWIVWAEFTRPDRDSGILQRGKGREEIVWAGSSVSQVVKTCWVLLEMLVKHELMEAFRYKDARIFSPHHTVDALARVNE